MGGLRPLYWFYIKLSPTHFTIKLRPYKLHGSYPRVNIHWRHRVENFSTVQDFWTTCTCPENFTCFEIFFIIQHFWAIWTCPENQQLPWKFPLHCIEMFYIIQEFWATCACPENRVCSEISYCIEIFFIIQDFWATCTCPEIFQAGTLPPIRTPMRILTRFLTIQWSWTFTKRFILSTLRTKCYDNSRKNALRSKPYAGRPTSR